MEDHPDIYKSRIILHYIKVFDIMPIKSPLGISNYNTPETTILIPPIDNNYSIGQWYKKDATKFLTFLRQQDFFDPQSAYYYKKGESGTWKQHKVGSSAEEAIAGVFGDNLI